MGETCSTHGIIEKCILQSHQKISVIFFFSVAQQHYSGLGRLIVEV
jgi:hypothetical protein